MVFAPVHSAIQPASQHDPASVWTGFFLFFFPPTRPGKVLMFFAFVYKAKHNWYTSFTIRNVTDFYHISFSSAWSNLRNVASSDGSGFAVFLPRFPTLNLLKSFCAAFRALQETSLNDGMPNAKDCPTVQCSNSTCCQAELSHGLLTPLLAVKTSWRSCVRRARIVLTMYTFLLMLWKWNLSTL